MTTMMTNLLAVGIVAESGIRTIKGMRKKV
jgi:hypothetical protein